MGRVIRDACDWPVLILAAYISLFFVLPEAKWVGKAYYVFLAGMLFLGVRQRFSAKADIRIMLSYTWDMLIARLVQTPGPLLLIFCLGYPFVSLFWSPVFSWEEWGENLQKTLLIISWIAIAAFVAPRLYAASPVILAVGSIAALLSLGLGTENLQGRLTAIGYPENPVQSGVLYALTALWALWYMLDRQNTGKMRCAGGFAMIAALTILLASGSRGPMLAFAVAAFLLLFLQYHVSGRKKLAFHPRYLLFALFGIVAVVLIANQLPWQSWLQRGDSFRFLIWQQAWHDILQAPWLGQGLRAPFEITLPQGQYINHVHSLYLTSLREGGVVGLMSLLAMLGYSLWRAGRLFRAGVVSVTLPLSLLCFGLVIGLVDYNILLVKPDLLWLFLYLPIGTLLGLERRPR